MAAINEKDIMENMKFTLHELVVLGTIITSVTTAYILLSRDVDTLKSNVGEMRGEVNNVKRSTEQIKLDQIKISVMLDYLYYNDPEFDTMYEKRGQLDKKIEKAVNKRKTEHE